MSFEDLPVHVHDTAYIRSPVPAAVSRVTLQMWGARLHPEAPIFLPAMGPMPPRLDSALRYVQSEATDFTHGIIVCAVQRRYGETPTAPKLATLQQMLRFTAMSSTVVEDQAVLYWSESKRHVSKWMWHHLAGQLLHPAERVGEPPAPAA